MEGLKLATQLSIRALSPLKFQTHTQMHAFSTDQELGAHCMLIATKSQPNSLSLQSPLIRF
jgi:hypothetical protein